MSTGFPHPEWLGPFEPDPNNPSNASLHVYNSLTSSKTAFIPISGKAVKWYACGPTVYDSAHLGHARAYVTFDILRRIMEDYFGYHVTLVMNITDIDDKIILKARQNHLLEQYTTAATEAKTVHADVSDAFKKNMESRATEIERLTALIPTAQKRYRKDMLESLAGEKVKLKNVQDAEKAFEKSTEGLDLTDAKSVSALLALKTTRDELAARLDKALGSTVTDQKIYRAHAKKYEEEFFEDLEALGVRKPSSLTRVSEYVEHIKVFVKRILERGFAYATEDGNVFFDVAAFKQAGHNYGKCAPWCVGNAMLVAEGEGSMAASGKKGSADFALWKTSKPGEPKWDSEWGEGRPGWHIECSAMATDVLGDQIDIHTGGEDLKFPHHDNELAQSEAYSGESQWVNHFWHAGRLNIDGLKMSKSLKNFITIRQILSVHSARLVRFLFLLTPWDKRMMFSDDSLKEASTKEAVIRNFFQSAQIALRKFETLESADEQTWNEADRKLNVMLDEAQAASHVALCDNFNYPAVMTHIMYLISTGNAYLTDNTTVKCVLLKRVAFWIHKMLTIFGAIAPNASFGFETGSTGNGKEKEALLTVFSSFRDQIRAIAQQTKDFKILELCDALRDDVLPELGIRLEDVSNAPAVFKFDDPAVLLNEKKQRRAAAAKKLVSRLAARKKELAKWTAASADPATLFSSDPTYTGYTFDETGLPVADSKQEDLSNGQKKKLKKLMEKQKKQKLALDKKLATTPTLLADVQTEITKLTDQVSLLTTQ